MRGKIFYTIIFGFLLGTLWRSFFFLDGYFVLLLLFLALAGKVRPYPLSTGKVRPYLLGVFLGAVAFGIFRFNLADQPRPEIFEKEIVGIIVTEPDVRENNQKLTLKTKETKILVTAGLERYFHYGDKIKISGKIEKPKNFNQNETGSEKIFDYISYLRKDGIFYLASYPKIEILSKGNGNFLKRILFQAKGKFLEVFAVSLPSPESLLLGGLILGERSAFSEKLKKQFINTGTIHIVALSGYNVTIVAEWIMKIFAFCFFFLPKSVNFGAGILGIILFVLMAGGQATAVRAGIMAILAVLARAGGREYVVARGLALAAGIMVLINPYVLVFDVSFQLSFIATVAVIFVAPKMEKYFFWIRINWFRDVITTTFSAYIFVLPFVLFKLENLSLVALPANILVLPFIPLTMVFGFLAGFLGLLSSYLAAPFIEAVYFLLHYELWIIDFFAQFPFASFLIPNFPGELVLLFYFLFILWWWKPTSLADGGENFPR